MGSAKIKFCRYCYTLYGKYADITEVVYESGRTRTFYNIVDVPATVRRYIESAPYERREYDSILGRREYLYSHRPI